jgi:HK97 family phage major capsid protein
MSAELADLVKEIKTASENIAQADAKASQRIDAIEKSINALYVKVNRPGSIQTTSDDEALERKDAIGLCKTRRALTVPKIDAGVSDNYQPSSAEIDDGLLARRGIKNLWRHANPERLDQLERKSLSSFTLGTNAFILPPTLATQALSCIVDPTDMSGLVNVVNISGPSIKFLIDNVRISVAAWACEASCFANNPQPDLQAGLGEMEIKAETLRFVLCVTNDLLADASFPLEPWIMRKVADGFRVTISAAIIAGDGLGKPMGILNPNAGIPILDTSPSTPAGQVTWQDLVQLKWDIPIQWHGEGMYFMNQRTWALIATMSDGIGRPLWTQLPGGAPGFMLNGSPVQIVTHFPDCLPGNTPVAFGNLKQPYTLVNRAGTTMIPDPYSAGWCTLFKFDARVGGNLTCANAMRLLRIR